MLKYSKEFIIKICEEYLSGNLKDKYKEKIEYKNVYYFNAIIKELQNKKFLM